MQIFKNLVCQKYKMLDKFILVFKPKKTITQQIHSHTRISKSTLKKSLSIHLPKSLAVPFHPRTLNLLCVSCLEQCLLK